MRLLITCAPGVGVRQWRCAPTGLPLGKRGDVDRREEVPQTHFFFWPLLMVRDMGAPFLANEFFGRDEELEGPDEGAPCLADFGRVDEGGALRLRFVGCADAYGGRSEINRVSCLRRVPCIGAVPRRTRAAAFSASLLNGEVMASRERLLSLRLSLTER